MTEGDESVLSIVNYTDGSKTTDSRAGDFDKYDWMVFKMVPEPFVKSPVKAECFKFGNESSTVDTTSKMKSRQMKSTNRILANKTLKARKLSRAVKSDFGPLIVKFII